MTREYETLCKACRRVRLPFDGTCTSFPDGIPDSIYAYGHDHRESVAGEEPFQLDPARQAFYDEWLANSPWAHGEPEAADIW